MHIWTEKEDALDKSIKGFICANPEKYDRLETEYGYGLCCKNLPDNQVRVIVNGGGGYGPMWMGLADDGLADAMVEGSFDSAPNAYVLYEMAKKIDCGKGILLITNHFMGDYLNNDMAAEILMREGILVKVVYVKDDMLSSKEDEEKRTGLHGIGQVCKIAAAAAKEKKDLEKVYRLAEKVNKRLRSVAVNIRENKMFFGEGFSGEPAVVSMPYLSSDYLAEKACEMMLSELERWKNDAIYISLNTNASMCYIEGFILLHSVETFLKDKNKTICGSAVGSYFDVFPDKGGIITLLPCDTEIQQYMHSANGYGFRI